MPPLQAHKCGLELVLYCICPWLVSFRQVDTVQPTWFHSNLLDSRRLPGTSGDTHRCGSIEAGSTGYSLSCWELDEKMLISVSCLCSIYEATASSQFAFLSIMAGKGEKKIHLPTPLKLSIWLINPNNTSSVKMAYCGFTISWSGAEIWDTRRITQRSNVLISERSRWR